MNSPLALAIRIPPGKIRVVSPRGPAKMGRRVLDGLRKSTKIRDRHNDCSSLRIHSQTVGMLMVLL